jgi:lipopolysaccharide transport system permease protein
MARPAGASLRGVPGHPLGDSEPTSDRRPGPGSGGGAPPTARRADAPVLFLRPPSGWVPLRLSELWSYRELVAFLAWRDIKVRYKQTALGGAWAIIQPLFTMLVFSVFFGRLAKVPSNGLPYPLFALCALIPWQFFATALTQASNSVVAEKQLVTKVYFPRLAVPLSAVLASLVDLVVSFCILLVMMAYYRVMPGPAAFLLPVFVVLAFASALSVSLWLSALNVRYRDFRYTIPFIVQFWLFATPVAYPSSLVPERWRVLYGLNPMAGVVEGFRWALLAGPRPPLDMLGASAAAVAVILVSGLFYFRRTERTFADLV